MKSQTTSAVLAGLFASSLSLAQPAQPKVNLNDPRFKNWKPAGPSDSRSACPGLNSLANHGFLPHSGQGVNATAIVRASFEGFGMSPEVPAIIVLKALEDAMLPVNASFDLHDADRESWKIEHARSFSRDDFSAGGDDLPPAETSRFQKRPWDVALGVMDKCGKVVDADCFGRARAARVVDGGRRPPMSNYDRAAAGHGAVESARIMLALGSAEGARLDFIKSVFEHERLPRHLGWEPRSFSGHIDEMLDVAVETQESSKVLRCASNGRVATRLHIIRLFESSAPGFTDKVKTLVRAAGFSRKSIAEALDKIEQEKGQVEDQEPESECERDSNKHEHESDSDGHDRHRDEGSDSDGKDDGSDGKDDGSDDKQSGSDDKQGGSDDKQGGSDDKGSESGSENDGKDTGSNGDDADEQDNNSDANGSDSGKHGDDAGKHENGHGSDHGDDSDTNGGDADDGDDSKESGDDIDESGGDSDAYGGSSGAGDGKPSAGTGYSDY